MIAAAGQLGSFGIHSPKLIKSRIQIGVIRLDVAI